MVRVSPGPACQLRHQQTAHLRHHRGAVSGFLLAVILVGSIDVALRAYSAIGIQAQTEKVVSVKIQDRLTALVAEDSQKALVTPVKPLHTPDPSASSPGSDATGVFSVDNIAPTDGFVSAATRPAVSTRPNSAVNSTPGLQSKTMERRLFSPPTRKPKRPIGKAPQSKAKQPLSNVTESKAKEAGGQEDGGPKPLAFGSIGYNYNPQQ